MDLVFRFYDEFSLQSRKSERSRRGGGPRTGDRGDEPLVERPEDLHCAEIVLDLRIVPYAKKGSNNELKKALHRIRRFQELREPDLAFPKKISNSFLK